MFEDHTRSVLAADNGGQWRTVNDNAKTFFLAKQSAVLINYGLPVTQGENPQLDTSR